MQKCKLKRPSTLGGSLKVARASPSGLLLNLPRVEGHLIANNFRTTCLLIINSYFKNDFLFVAFNFPICRTNLKFSLKATV